MKTCSVDGCAKLHRARGLCSTHYNQTNKRFIELPCAWCGTVVLKEPTSKYSNRFCDLACRDEWRWWNEKPLACPVPATHLSRSTSVPIDHPSRVPLSCEVPLSHPSRALRRPRFHAGRCMDCRGCFVIDSEFVGKATHYCSELCARRTHRRRRRAREAGATGDYTWDAFMRLTLELGNVCAYCDAGNGDRPLDPDHVVPLSRGGHNGLTNLLPACRTCNGDKRDLLIHEWASDRARRGLPPRRYDVDRFLHLTAHAHAV